MTTVGFTTEERKYLKNRIKFASSAVRIYALQSEIAKYNLKGLRKSAAIGANKLERMKLAALHRQYALEREKTANLAWLLGQYALKKPGLLQHAASGVRKGVSGLFGLGSSAVKGALPGLRDAAGGAATQVGKFAKKNPTTAMVGGMGLGLAGGSQLGNLQEAGSSAASGIGDAAKATGNYMSNLTNIPGDILGGFGKAFGRFGGSGGSGGGSSAGGSAMPSDRADYQERFKNYRLRPNRL